MRILLAEDDKKLGNIIMPQSKSIAVGTKHFLSTIRNRFPKLQIGNFSHYNEEGQQ